jgi:uncharacterized membrane protein YfcA
MYFIIFSVAILAFGISAVCGGGASFILLPALGVVLPAAQVPAALSVGTAVSSISRIFVFKKHVRWDIVAWFVPPALPAVWLGARLLSSINPAWLEFIIGLFLVANLPFVFKPGSKASQQNSKWILVIIGTATGFISGLTGAVGLLFNRFYLTYGLTKEEIIATRAANEMLLHVVKIVLYSMFGLLSAKALGAGITLSVAAVLSAWLMKQILRFFTENTFKRIGFTAMVGSGIIMLFSSGYQLYHQENLRVNVVAVNKGLEATLRYKQRSFAVELVLNEGLEVEKAISFKDLPAQKQTFARRLTQQSQIVLIEAVYGWGRQSHEIYLLKNGRLLKYEF